MEISFGQYTINDSTEKVDLDFVHHELSNSYWAKNIPRSLLEKAIRHCINFNVFHNETQVAFARVITDQATYAYLCDVIVNEDHGGKGIGKAMMKFIMDHPELQGLRRFTLATRDAHTLYTQFGFEVTKNPENMMEIVRRDIYLGK
ncbi:MAG TPA: GNAT family N-acetyltransferase [Bacteroidia bacterium]|jgi:N-acetylglutamate synthase-like GNAT family acetyltransferase|nr:GNAT family N-acetyltransferase [Bacteroidia bacterium]